MSSAESIQVVVLVAAPAVRVPPAVAVRRVVPVPVPPVALPVVPAGSARPAAVAPVAVVPASVARPRVPSVAPVARRAVVVSRSATVVKSSRPWKPPMWVA